MRRLRRSPMRQLLAAALLVAVGLVVEIVLLSSSSSPPPRVLESIFQDDDHLVYATTATVTSTLDTLSDLGVDAIRVTVQWSALAPTTVPAGFHPTDPSDYPAAAWAPYDRVVELAHARGIAVDFNISAPGPLWAMAPAAPSPSLAANWYPSAADFGQFVTAVGTRYSGHYTPPGGSAPLPRVDFWSIWNEPNQPGWLAPQWRAVASSQEMEAPVLYRAYVDASFSALERTGHGPSTDTILVGELAPEGCETGSPCAYPRYDYPIPPITFLRALYCVGASGRPLTGAAASAVGCAVNGDQSAFVAANPGLFEATGLSEHPYSFFLAPYVKDPDPNFVPLSDLPRLEHALDTIFHTYAVDRKLPLYLTEYGYETNPPNPFRGVSPQLQSLYLNEAQYMAWRDPRVRALSQFLLYDSPPDTRYRPGTQGYWSTFQTGLLFANGVAKLSLSSYRLPVFLPDPVLGPGQTVLIWAMLRAAPRDGTQQAQIQWRPTRGSFRTIETDTARAPDHVIAVRVRLPGPGLVRIAWTSPSGGRFYSRLVAVSGS